MVGRRRGTGRAAGADAVRCGREEGDGTDGRGPGVSQREREVVKQVRELGWAGLARGWAERGREENWAGLGKVWAKKEKKRRRRKADLNSTPRN